MRRDDTEADDAASLRRQAEESLRAQPARSNGSPSHEEALALVHELQVHQIELELQNEELMRTRREAEALRDRYADLYDFAPVGYFTLDEAGAIREANLAGAVQLGVDRESLIGARFATFLHPDCGPGFAAFCARILAGGTTETCEVPFAARGGRGTWYAQLRGRADAAAGTGAVRLVVTDITDLRRAEETLRESEAKYRSLVNDDITGILTSALDGRILDCNPAFARMFGFASVGEARSSSITETYEPPADWRVLLDRLRRDRRIKGDTRYRRRRDGERIHVTENLIGEFDAAGDLVRFKGYVVDDTRRYRVEEALRASEERLRLAQEGANVAVWDRDIRTGRQTYTLELLRLYGLEEDRIYSYDLWREHVHPDDLERVEAEQDAALACGTPFDLEFRIVWPSGEVRWLSSIGRGVYDGQGTLVRVLGVNLDITERKEAEAYLQEYAERLRTSNEELQRFAYVASHDLQEPLRTIVSFSQLLERRCRGQLGPEADEYIAFIVAGGMRMQALIRDLLQLSRIETQAQPPVPIGAGAVVADAVSTLEAPIREAGATVTVGPMPTVMADPTQLELVFTNLIGNAIKYRSPERPPEIRISGERCGPFWEFAVADNGIGIESEFFDRIFQMFQRLHTQDEFSGTGIGLAVVKKIVERHGGKIRVESMPGEGSTFFFTLPAG